MAEAAIARGSRILFSAFVVAAVPSLCSCEKPRATITDAGRVRAHILAIDGRPVERATSKYVTVVPVAFVEPGRHTLSVRFEADSVGAPGETLSVAVTVEPGKHYRFALREGKLEIVEEPKE